MLGTCENLRSESELHILHERFSSACWQGLRLLLFNVVLQVSFRQLVSPVLQNLTNHRANPFIIKFCSLLDYVVAASCPPSSAGALTLCPAVNLSFIICATSTKEETAIPLKPSVR